MVHLKTLTVLLAATLVSACATPRLEINPKVVDMTKRVAVPDAQLAGPARALVRTYVKGSDGKNVELGNAVCTLRSREYSGRVTTPQLVKYTAFLQAARFKGRGKPGPLVVTCLADGKKATTTLEPIPLGAETRRTSDYVDGQIAVQTVVLSGQLASSYPWGYPYAINLVLE
ncbi:MAG: hypothetical protein ABJL99_18520 [Aliishimia sp.]